MICSIQVRSARAGFSFVEIIIALMIIGIMTIGAFSMFKWLDSAKRTRTEATLKALQMDISQFQIHTGTYPQALVDLAIRPTDATIAKKWRGPYVEETALKDGWGNELQYQINPKGTKRPYELFSWGKKGEDGVNGERIDVWES